VHIIIIKNLKKKTRRISKKCYMNFHLKDDLRINFHRLIKHTTWLTNSTLRQKLNSRLDYLIPTDKLQYLFEKYFKLVKNIISLAGFNTI